MTKRNETQPPRFTATARPPKATELEIEKELRHHVEMLVQRGIEQGLSQNEARARAEARLGSLEHVRQECRVITSQMEIAAMDSQHASWWSTIRQDAQYALRVLWRTKLFTATALITLAVGIGATTAIFSVVNAVLLRPLPYPAAERTQMIFNRYQQEGLSQAAVSTPEFEDLRNKTRAFDALAGIRPQDSALTDDCAPGAICEPERVKAYVISPELFDLLGVSPARGRGFTHADGLATIAGADRAVMISDALWRRRYGADASLVGRVISLGGLPRTVVGIMPPGVRFPDDAVSYMKDPADLWIPMAWEDRKDERGNQYLVVLGRKRAGVSDAQVAAELQAASNSLKSEYADRYAEPRVHWQFGSKPLREEMVGDVRTALVVLFSAVGCVLLIACANVANLILARGTTRRRELAVRTALGANRARLIQQLLIETLVLTSIGALAGIAIAIGALKVLITINPGGIPRIENAAIDIPVLAFAAGLALLSGVIVGLVPAIRQAKADPQTALGDGARGTDASAPRRRMRGALVMAEVTLAVIVLVGALLLIRSFIAMSRVPTGVNLTGAAIAQVTIPRATYNSPEKITAFHRTVVERLQAIPGVRRAAGIYPLPLSGEGWSGTVTVEGWPTGSGIPDPHAELGVATPNYFQTAGIPLLEGRTFTDSDIIGNQRVVVIDDQFAKKYFGGQSPIGRRVSTNGDLVNVAQVVIGVVGHVRNGGARRDGEGQVYMAALQTRETSLYYIADSGSNPRALLTQMRGTVHDLDARLPMARLTTGGDLVAKFTARERFNVLLFTTFGVVALALAAIGLYGVLAFLVTQRTREIGIRMALGGRPGGIVRGIISEGLLLTLGGLTAGLGGAYLLARSMKELLFSIEATDPTTYVIAALLMIAVSLAAAFAPARRATKVDPVDVLR